MDAQKISEVRNRARCLFDEQQVEAALDKMAAAMTDKLAASNPIILCVMNGGLIVTGKLATRLDFPLQLDYLHATRYRDATSGGDLKWQAHPKLTLEGRVVVVVDDILDEGVTLEAILAYCHAQDAAEVYSAVLINKAPARKLSSVTADFWGLAIGDEYVFGYGMDYKGYLRNAAGIYAVAQEDI